MARSSVCILVHNKGQRIIVSSLEHLGNHHLLLSLPRALRRKQTATSLYLSRDKPPETHWSNHTARLIGCAQPQVCPLLLLPTHPCEVEMQRCCIACFLLQAGSGGIEPQYKGLRGCLILPSPPMPVCRMNPDLAPNKEAFAG